MWRRSLSFSRCWHAAGDMSIHRSTMSILLPCHPRRHRVPTLSMGHFFPFLIVSLSLGLLFLRLFLFFRLSKNLFMEINGRLSASRVVVHGQYGRRSDYAAAVNRTDRDHCILKSDRHDRSFFFHFVPPRTTGDERLDLTRLRLTAQQQKQQRLFDNKSNKNQNKPVRNKADFFCIY